MINATAPNDYTTPTNDDQKLLARAMELLDTMPKETVITNPQLTEFLSKNFTLHHSVHRYFLTRTVTNPDVITFVWHRGFYYAFAGDAFKLHCLLGYNVSFDEGVLTVCLLEQATENAETIKTLEIANLRTQEAVNRLVEKAAIDLTQNSESAEDEDEEDYFTVSQYLEDTEDATLNDAIQINASAIELCQNRGIELRETILNNLGTVYAFPVSVLREVDKKRQSFSDDENEHYYTVPQYFNCVPNRHKNITLSDAIKINALAFNLCEKKGIKIKQEIFTTWGTMNAFPVSIIEQVERYFNQ